MFDDKLYIQILKLQKHTKQKQLKGCIPIYTYIKQRRNFVQFQFVNTPGTKIIKLNLNHYVKI